MIETLDSRIARLSAELDKLRLLKMRILRRQSRELEDRSNGTQAPEKLSAGFTGGEVAGSPGRAAGESGGENTPARHSFGKRKAPRLRRDAFPHRAKRAVRRVGSPVDRHVRLPRLAATLPKRPPPGKTKNLKKEGSDYGRWMLPIS